MKRAVKLDELWERAEHQEKEQRKASKPAKATAETKRLHVERQVPFTIEALTKKSRGTRDWWSIIIDMPDNFFKAQGQELPAQRLELLLLDTKKRSLVCEELAKSLPYGPAVLIQEGANRSDSGHRIIDAPPRPRLEGNLALKTKEG